MLTLSNGSQIFLADKPLGRGGEGEVFQIKSPSHHVVNVAKIFYSNKRTPEREQKLKYLIAKPPKIEENGHTFLIWALDILYENGNFVGFIMPRAEGVELELLCDDDFLNYPEYQGSIWEKFAFSQPNSQMIRLNIVYNICAAIAAVHAKKDYVLVDLKPVNIKITDKGMVCIIDIDSIQVTEKGKLLFASKVATPEYSPPEVIQKPTIKDEYWDRFSLAIIIYRILVGIHPFSGSLKPPHDKITVYEDLIKNGFYPHGKNKDKFAVINPTHNRLFTYPKSVVETLKKVFDDYLFQPNKRPSAIDWTNNVLNFPVKIEFFNPKNKRYEIIEGENITLEWQIENEYYTELNGIDVTGQNQHTSNPTDTQKYRLIAKSTSGKFVEQEFTIQVHKLPKIHFFKSSANDVGEGQQVTLSWNAEHHTNLFLNGKKIANHLREHKFIPKTQTNCILEVENQYGKDISKTVIINVHKPPLLLKIWTDKKAITSDDIVNVQWQAIRADEFILTWVVFEEATNSWKQNTETLLNTVTSHALDVKGSNKECKISLVAKSKYGTSTLPYLSIKVVNMPEFQFVPNKIDAIPEITALPLTQFPKMPVLAINTTQQIFTSYTSYPEKYKSYVDEQNNRKVYFFIFCICLTIVSAVIGFFGSLIL